MKLKTFIDRPILSCAISVLILILGVIGLSNGSNRFEQSSHGAVS